MLKFCQKSVEFVERRLVYKTESADQEVDTAEDHGACGVAGVVDLDGFASNENVRMTIQAGERMHLRSGVTVDDNGRVFGADGSGVLMDTGRKGQWIDMLTFSQRHEIHDPDAVQVAMVHFDRSLTDLDVEETRRAIDDCFHRRGIKVLDWEQLKTNEDRIDPRRLPRIPRYHKVTFLVPGIDRQHDTTTLYRIARRINNRIRGVKLASLAMDRVVFKGVLMGSELMNFFPILQHLEAMAVIAHDRFSTNVVTDQEQPFGSLAHNGEINSVAATRKALMNMAAAWGFKEKILVNGGSDSAHLNDALELMLANGVPLPEALIRLIPPALLKTDDPKMRKFIQASKRAMGTFGMWEGPAAVLALDDTHFVAHMDRLGLRPARWKEVQYHDRQRTGRRFTWSSEEGAVPFECKNILRTGNLKAGDTLAVKLGSGEILTGENLIEDVMSNSGLNWNELCDTGIVIPKRLSKRDFVQPVKINAREVKKNPILLAKLAAFGWTDAKIASAVERIKEGRPVITSMGFHGPLAILDPNLNNLNDLYLARAAIITNPPFDPNGEPDAIETDVYLGRMPNMEVDNKAYEPIYPQWHQKLPILTSSVLREMQDKADTVFVDATQAEVPKMKKIDITFNGDYKVFLAKIAAIKKEVVKLASASNGDGVSVVVLSDRNAFNGEFASMAIPPVLLVQEINTELVNNGLDRNISLVVDSGTIRSGHDVGLLIAQGASGVCPWLLEEVAAMADDSEQALFNLYKELNTELIKMMSKNGITTVLGAKTGYWFSAVGLAPEVAKNGGAKTVSQVGGIGMQLIYQALVQAQLLRLSNPERWIESTSDKADKKEGAYDEFAREFFNLAAKPDAEALKKLIIKAGAYGDVLKTSDFPKLFGGGEFSPEELSDIAFRAGGKMRLSKLLTLRDCLGFGYKYGELTPELLAQAPSIESILKCLKMCHMSLGAHGKVAHPAMVRGCNKVGVESSSGEGGEEKSRNRTSSRSLDRSHSRQVGTAGWGVDRAYLCEADEICIKIAQGAKPGEGGDLPGQKVDEFIAEIRHVKAGTRLISPPPNHDIYSIEDLQARIWGFRALNPRARISIKMASMPGLGTIAVGAAKAGADILEISGFDAGTGAAGEQSIEYCGYPVEIGLAEVHQYLVKAGLRNRIKLVADGKMMTAADFVKMRKIGADVVGFGTLLMIYVQCIACSNCHTNKCPKGITTQDGARQRKYFVGGEGVMDVNDDLQDEFQIEAGSEGVKNGILALARDIRGELAIMGITEENFNNMIGDVNGLYQIETGNPVVDSLNMEQVVLAKCEPPQWMTPEDMISDTSKSAANVYKNPLSARILLDAEKFLTGAVDELELSCRIESIDREVGVGLSGAIYERLERFGNLRPEQVIILNTVGEGGHNYGAWAGNGMVLRHEGFLNDSVGQGMSGNAKIIVKAHRDLREKEGHVLIGNQACMWATGGTLYCPGKAGARLGVRNSGAVIVAEGSTDYPFEYMTAGEGYMLGDWVGEIGSRMTGGKLFVYDPGGSRRQKISKAYVRTEEIVDADLQGLKERLEDYFKETESPKAGRILDHREVEKLNFAKIVALS